MRKGKFRGGSQFIMAVAVVIFGFIGGAGATFRFSGAFAANHDGQNPTYIHPNIVTPTPTAPTDNTIGLSATSGPPGTHLFLAASGYQPGEAVQEIWNYQGPGTGIPQKSFYYFNPIGTANSNGIVDESFNVPLSPVGTYTIATVGLKSNIVKTAQFQLAPALDLGIYIGPPGSVLRFNGWGFAKHEGITLSWNGQLIGNASTDSKGDFSGRTFTVPAGTVNGTYGVTAVGSTSQAQAQAQFTVGTPSLNTTPPGPSDWYTFGYDLQGTRVNTAENTIGTSNVSTLALKWKSATPVPYNVTGSPLVVDGVVYVGTIEGMVIAYDAATGNVLWTFNTRGPVYGSPAVVSGIAYFGSVNYPSEDVIGNFAYAVNATDGSLIWENFLGYGGEWVTPLVVNGRVFFSSAGKEGISGGFSAFDASTGATLWSVSTPYGIWAPDTIDPSGTNLYVGTGNPCFTEPQPTNCAGYLEDLDPTTGNVKWQIHFVDLSGDDDVPAAPAYANGMLYLGTKNGIFYCIDATNGNILWQYNTGHVGDNGIFSSAALYNGMVFFGGGDHIVHALNAGDGSQAWSFTTGSVIVSSPAVANGVLYIGSEDGNVYALDPSSGKELWSYATDGAIMSSPIVSNGVLYITSNDGYVYAFTPVPPTTNNTAEDNFQRPNTTAGWGTTTNNDSLTNYPWLQSLNNSSNAFIQSNTGLISYPGANGHMVGGYIGTPAQEGGDALVEFSFNGVGYAVGGALLQVTGSANWYQGDINTNNSTLEIRRRFNSVETTVASVPFTCIPDTTYWIRLDIQADNGMEQLNMRAWVAGTAEPTGWLVTYTDASPLPTGAAGAMGEWFKLNGPVLDQQINFDSWSYAAEGLASPAR
jgi:outer membrane protein assembly factor BamB